MAKRKNKNEMAGSSTHKPNLSGKKVVFATGVFDLLHQEHRNFLKKAKEQGDVLIVGVESDKRVRETKGEERPIQPQHVRVQQVKNLPEVDDAFILPDNIHDPSVQHELLQRIHPDVLAISSHSPHQEEKRRMMEQIGGTLKVVHQHNPAVSSTQILESQTNSRLFK